MSRIVLDTNVVIAAFAARGLCESVFELCLESHDLEISEFLLSELQEKLSKKLKLPQNVIQDIVDLYKKNSLRVTPSDIGIDACRDPKNVPVIGTCVKGKADYLISGDQDLLILKNYGSTKILSPRDFYESQK